MKKIFLFCLLALICREAIAQTLLNIKSFGATGNGKTDDTKAFLQAFAKINSLKKNVILQIPAGNYLLQPQTPTTGNPAFQALDIIALSNCSYITIKGEKGSKIQFASSLYYGAFRRNGKEVKKFETKTTEYAYRVAIGHGIKIDNSSNISIQSLELDGNNRNFILGTEYGDVGMQIDNDGIFITNGDNINLTNMNIHHFGRDGIQIINKTPQGFNTSSQNIAIDNCKFEYNGRQAFSWTGGVGLKANNSSFSYTGKPKLSSPPGAGVDFEPNGGYIVKDGTFVNCVFKSNNGLGVLADQGGFNVTDIQFVKCLVQGESSAAIWVKSPSFTFTDCTVNGSFYFGCPARNQKEGTKFIRCSFSDQYSANSNTNFLVESNESKYLLFDQCSFKAKTLGLLYIAASTQAEERATLKDCRLIALYKTGPRANAFTTGVDFAGKTVFIDSVGRNNEWNLENSRFVGTKGTDASVEIGPDYRLASYAMVTIGDDQKSTNLTIDKNSLLSINNYAKVVIGEKGKLIIKKGGALWVGVGAEIVIKGKIIAEKGAYLCINNQAKISEASLKNINVEGGVNFTDNPEKKYGLSGCIIIR